MIFTRPEQILVYSLGAEDLPATVQFYRDVIGLPLLPHHGRHPAFDLGNGAYLVIVQGQRPAALGTEDDPFPHLAFTVESLDEAVEHLATHGLDLPWGIEAGPSEQWVKFYDPAGNLIEFAQVSRSNHA